MRSRVRAGLRAAAAAGGSAAGAAATRRLAASLPHRARQPWERTNYAGRPLTLLEGPAWLGGAATGIGIAALLEALDRDDSSPPAIRSSPAAALVVTVASGALGALDDLSGSASRKGLKGHLGALRRGELTTGAVKIAGLAVTGLAGALLSDRVGERTRVTGGRGEGQTGQTVVRTLVGGAVVAAAANVVNLFDLRPGRALKVVIAGTAPLAIAGSSSAGSGLGAAAGVVRDDLAGVSMLGDTGANAAGALAGLALIERCGLRGRLVALGLFTALTLASERVSFSAVIEANDVLRRLDDWGRARR
ncbi:MAG TPA: hypothetical protein VJN29_10125 [Intrasporangium sp.]|uniref:hypothetical protein n=1 Tax=Intrasporangium sp. TaxID=1925024 RepID=UPI002B4A0C84|nr:hypothetical protein [Intrasporangium sp.]HKX67571.1 hypothetical protein [Intrasporangium sp.]